MRTSTTIVASVCVSLATLAAAPLAWAADDDPYFINKREFRRTYKTIALSPVDAPGLFNMPDSVAAALEEEVTKRLERRGIEVLPSSVLAGIRSEMAGHIGGLIDPDSGEESPARVRTVREHANRELWFRHGIDAVATIRIDMVDAHFEKGRAEWDGVKQKLIEEGRDRGYGGNIRASSVAFTIYDPTGRPLYAHYGGIELLQKRVEAQLLPIPASEYFSDDKRVRKAAQISVSEI